VQRDNSCFQSSVASSCHTFVTLKQRQEYKREKAYIQNQSVQFDNCPIATQINYLSQHLSTAFLSSLILRNVDRNCQLQMRLTHRFGTPKHRLHCRQAPSSAVFRGYRHRACQLPHFRLRQTDMHFETSQPAISNTAPHEYMLKRSPVNSSTRYIVEHPRYHHNHHRHILTAGPTEEELPDDMPPNDYIRCCCCYFEKVRR
jgi:hypothetical protein